MWKPRSLAQCVATSAPMLGASRHAIRSLSVSTLFLRPSLTRGSGAWPRSRRLVAYCLAGSCTGSAFGTDSVGDCDCVFPTPLRAPRQLTDGCASATRSGEACIFGCKHRLKSERLTELSLGKRGAASASAEHSASSSAIGSAKLAVRHGSSSWGPQQGIRCELSAVQHVQRRDKSWSWRSLLHASGCWCAGGTAHGTVFNLL